MPEIAVLKYCMSKRYRAERHLFLKRHEDNETGVTVTNVPPFVRDTDVKALLENVVGEDKVVSAFAKPGSAGGFRVVVVYFDSELWLTKCFKAVSDTKPISLESIGVTLPPLGLKKYAVEYSSQFKPVEELRQEIESAVAAYDEHVQEKKKEVKEAAQEVDEEGWTTVVAGQKHSFKARGKKLGVQNKTIKKQKEKNKTPFYASETKLAKLEAVRSVHQQFDENKQKIAALRSARKFKPD